MRVVELVVAVNCRLDGVAFPAMMPRWFDYADVGLLYAIHYPIVSALGIYL